ncbi:hypothetical protein [Yersinia thracica]|uniref:hypothetical protein n=1 Tax=Yersinia thracica TaxID=2890319 RepID=UPI00157D9D86|nr:hypothetical protein [Yersinia thracica]
MPSAVPKSLELSHELTALLQRGDVLSEMSFFRYIREIEKLKSTDKVTKQYLSALAHAANGRKREAIELFEASTLLPDPIKANNYLAYIASRGSMVEYKNLAIRLAQCYESKDFALSAHDCCMYFGETTLMKKFAEKFNKLSNKDEVAEMKGKFHSAYEIVNRFKTMTGLSDSDLSLVAKCVFSVIDKNECHAESVSFMSLDEEKSNSYIVTVDSDDIDKIADMNIDLSFSLAEHDELLDKQFSAWFLGTRSDQGNKHAS